MGFAWSVCKTTRRLRVNRSLADHEGECFGVPLSAMLGWRVHRTDPRNTNDGCGVTHHGHNVTSLVAPQRDAA